MLKPTTPMVNIVVVETQSPMTFEERMKAAFAGRPVNDQTMFEARAYVEGEARMLRSSGAVIDPVYDVWTVGIWRYERMIGCDLAWWLGERSHMITAALMAAGFNAPVWFGR